jgi:hypothetical protein
VSQWILLYYLLPVSQVVRYVKWRVSTCQLNQKYREHVKPSFLDQPDSPEFIPSMIQGRSYRLPTLPSSSNRRRSARIRHRNINHARTLRHNRNPRNSSRRICRRGRHTLLRLCFGGSAFGHHNGEIAVVCGGRRLSCSLCGVALWICGGGGLCGGI